MFILLEIILVSCHKIINAKKMSLKINGCKTDTWFTLNILTVYICEYSSALTLTNGLNSIERQTFIYC